MASVNQADPVFTIHTGVAQRRRWSCTSILARVADVLSGLDRLQQLYMQAVRRPEPQFVDRALAVLGIATTIVGRHDDLPASGPLLLVANHPQGAVDGLVVASLALARRSDVRILGNRLLSQVPEIAELLIPVDVFGGPSATLVNARALRATLDWLRRGGCVCVFPAGEVAHRGWGARAVEAAWHTSAVRLARRAGAEVLTVRLSGTVGVAFRIAGRIHPRLRTLLLPRLLLAQRGTTVGVEIGTPMPAAALAGNAADATCRLREAALDERTSSRPSAPVVMTADPVRREVAPLLESQVLVSQAGFSVFWTQGATAPALLDRLGRAREAAFRAAGEGTGLDVDLDGFDLTYRHLCLWDHRIGALAGAYRMGLVDELTGRGARLYTQTLFDYDARFVAALGPALELGRAFLAAPYQRQFAPLALLWSAIGRFVAAHPRYRTLFGAVSIDTAYGPAARHAMMTYLQQHASAPTLGALVTPKHPPSNADLADGRLAWAGTFAAPDLAALEAVVSRLDLRGRGMPVLLRQYLKLDARAVAFSIDPAFSHVLDTLIVVDLPSVAPALLRRFMGPAAAAAYLADHARAPFPQAEPGARRA